MKTEKGDFVEIKYVGRLEDGNIFDVNDKEIANKEKIPGHIHERTIICIGERDVVPGLDNFLIDKEFGKKLTVTIQSEDGFGKKNPNLFQIVPAKKFLDQKINPIAGLRVEIDQYPGVIKSVSGGRVLVDLNHPLAGRALHYEITILKKIESLKEKVAGFLELNAHMHNPMLEEREGVVTIKATFPSEMQAPLEQALKKRIPELKALHVQVLPEKE